MKIRYYDILLIIYWAVFQILEKKWEYNEVHQLLKDWKKAYDLVSREVLYNSLIEIGITQKLAFSLELTEFSVEEIRQLPGVDVFFGFRPRPNSSVS
jgi:hypothetical protein